MPDDIRDMLEQIKANIDQLIFRLNLCEKVSNFRNDAAKFKEEDHPRAEDGKFGSGGGSSKNASITKVEGKGFDAKEKTAIEEYGQGNSYHINKFLRDPKAGAANMKKNFGSRAGEALSNMKRDIKLLEKAIDKSVITKDTTLFRGVSDFSYIEKMMKDGDGTITFPTFSSTSKNQKWASDFSAANGGDKSKGGLLVIDAPAGSKGLDMQDASRFGHDEEEVVLSKDQKYKITKFDEKTRTLHVTLV